MNVVKDEQSTPQKLAKMQKDGQQSPQNHWSELNFRQDFAVPDVKVEVEYSPEDNNPLQDVDPFSEESNYTQKQEPDKPLPCLYPTCGHIFTLQSELDQHLLLLHKDQGNEHPCATCDLNFSSDHELKSHRQMFHSKDLFTCGHCFKTFPRKSNLIRHEKTHTGQEKAYHCLVPGCGKNLGNKNGFQLHLRNHELMASKIFRVWSCCICQKTFAFAQSLEMHTAEFHSSLAEEAKPFGCSLCEVRFSSRERLEEHLEGHGSEEGKIWSCSYCPRTFPRKFNWIRHENSHTNGRRKPKDGRPPRKVESQQGRQHKPQDKKQPKWEQLSFDQDDSESDSDSSSSPSSSKIKIEPEEDVEIEIKQEEIEDLQYFDDPECFPEGEEEESNSSRSSLKETENEGLADKGRKRKHSSVKESKPFACHHCDSRFSTAIALGQHVENHGGFEGGLYHCSYCPKTLSRKYNWTRHEASHTNDRKKSKNRPRKQQQKKKKNISLAKYHICSFPGCVIKYESAQLLEAHVQNDHINIKKEEEEYLVAENDDDIQTDDAHSLHCLEDLTFLQPKLIWNKNDS